MLVFKVRRLTQFQIFRNKLHKLVLMLEVELIVLTNVHQVLNGEVEKGFSLVDDGLCKVSNHHILTSNS